MKSFEREFADWVATKPANKAYQYSDHCGCAVYQFLSDTGYPVKWVGGYTWTDLNGDRHDLPESWTADDNTLQAKPRTFGALAQRLNTPEAPAIQRAPTMEGEENAR